MARHGWWLIGALWVGLAAARIGAACHATLADQPLAALVSIAIPEESRVLMAPLATAAGGWGQSKELWADTSAPGYQEMLKQVLRAAGPAAPTKGNP